MKKILYISPLSSKRLINSIHISTGNNFVFAGQKFNRLIVKGLIQNSASVEIYSAPPIHTTVGVRYVAVANEHEDGITYNYMNYFDIPFIKAIIVFLKSFIKVFKFGLVQNKDKCVICDILSVSLNLGAVLASKLVGVKIAGVVTDMPGLMVSNSISHNFSFIGYIYSKLNRKYISEYSHYIFLTKQMNNVINIHKKPFIVMEALCELSPSQLLYNKVNITEHKLVLYAGGLHEKYGLKLLVDGFRMLERRDIKLVLYGSGPYVDELMQVIKEDSRIEYRGVANNDEVLSAELEATLLVNPRPTNEEFTQYSFPSKNIEYMASGTAVLTTRLPGMPEEYYPYVYIFEKETVESYASTLDRVLNISPEQLELKGQLAKQFVLENKNYLVQTKRILELIS